MVSSNLLKWLTLAASLGLAHWFFGNLYEALVIAPNWTVDSPAQLQRLNEFFVHTSPTLFFVPMVPLATLLVWLVAFLNRDRRLGATYARASLYAALAMALNVLIVTTLITKLFGADYQAHASQLQSYAARWNLLNLGRMGLVATAATYLFNAFRQLDRV
jgi:phosphotransferase system  glucose/maltose/N-acetylglucosamine-specific IIC component